MKIYDLIDKLPYICLIDEFQETIYTKENILKEDINKIYFALSKKYHLENSYIGHLNLEHGNYFFRQTHLYTDPFYYIDYALSYFGAIAIWSKCSNDLAYFESLASVASYYPLKELIKQYHLPDPFDEENVFEVIKVIKKQLNI